jgi:rhodanese-related sulfurtransferase
MQPTSYKAEDLFEWVTQAGEDFLLLDVRVNEEFDRFKVEGPFLSDMVNVPYVEFVEHEEESVVKVPAAEKVRIVCAREGSAIYVGEILVNHGFKDVRFLEGGIKTWGNLLVPKRVASDDESCSIRPAMWIFIKGLLKITVPGSSGLSKPICRPIIFPAANKSLPTVVRIYWGMKTILKMRLLNT